MGAEIHTEPDRRIQRLEQDVRRLKIRLLALAAFLIVAIGLLGWRALTPRETLSAGALRIVDGSGTQVAELSGDERGATLTLKSIGATAVTLTAGREGAGLIVEDSTGPDISLLAGNQPYLYFGDPHDPRSVLIGLDGASGAPRLQLKDRNRIWLWGSDAGDGAILTARDRSGSVLWRAP